MGRTECSRLWSLCWTKQTVQVGGQVNGRAGCRQWTCGADELETRTSYAASELDREGIACGEGLFEFVILD